jgi:hypothetical protein
MLFSSAAFSRTSIILGIALAGCGGSTASITDGDGGADAGTDTGIHDGSPSPDTGVPDGGGTGCPSSLPADGSPCPMELPYVCEYGDNVHCTTTASCYRPGSGGQLTWHVTPPDPTCGHNAAQCPSSFGTPPNGSACPVAATCDYTEGRCTCASCFGDAGAQTDWTCAPWLMPPNCPEPRPLLGTACAQDNQECAYGPPCCGVVDTGPDMKCIAGVWTALMVACDCPAHLCGQ